MTKSERECEKEGEPGKSSWRGGEVSATHTGCEEGRINKSLRGKVRQEAKEETRTEKSISKTVGAQGLGAVAKAAPELR